MPQLKPWYKVVNPREDLREGKPLDASEFAVHLDQVRDGKGSKDYSDPLRFFERTFLTTNLRHLASQVVRRLAGETTETSAVFNMATQFGGGKTHALTLLYHLANKGPRSRQWLGVPQILEAAGVNECPECATAVFVGNEFDAIQGRGGEDGTPVRKTPWGEIAYQLAGPTGLSVVAEHEAQRVAPAGDAIRRFLPRDRPSLILMDELMNFISANRKSGLSAQLYNFLQNLSEVARSEHRVVLVGSIPASELEMNADDHSDYKRFKKVLDRLGKAIVMSAETETSEIIRRRLFEWDTRAVTPSGRVVLDRSAKEACAAYASWLIDHRQQVPNWFAADHGQEAFEATYPFHPMVLSVFERKWQNLPGFQQTRGVLRLLALWVSNAFQTGFKGARSAPLIDLGSAPLDDPTFRSAVFEQLGEGRLEGAVTTDIAGKRDSHAIRLDAEAVDTIKKAQLHRKAATAVFFESNGGQAQNYATLPEVRLAVAGPEVDLGNVETALEALTDGCYYLSVEQNRYRFSTRENLNKRFADRRASVRDVDIDEMVRQEIRQVFVKEPGTTCVFFPEKSGQVDDRPIITMVVVAPSMALQDEPKCKSVIEGMTREHGNSSRTYKSALIWVVPDSSAQMRDEARKLIAWQDIRDEGLNLDETQQRQLETNLRKAKRDLKESVWRAYKHLFLLGKNNDMKGEDLGLVTSSAADSMPKFILQRLRESGEVEKEVGPRYLDRNWPPAFAEWSTRSVRDAFYASPQFPRLIDGDTVRNTIARGVAEGILAYVGKAPEGRYKPFKFEEEIESDAIEVSEDMFIIRAEEARKHIEPPALTKILVEPPHTHMRPGARHSFRAQGLDQFGRAMSVVEGAVTWDATGGSIDSGGTYEAGASEGNYLVRAHHGDLTGVAEVAVMVKDSPPTEPPKGSKRVRWSGDVPPQKWMNLYTKVLTRLVTAGDLSLRVSIEASPEGGLSRQQVDEMKAALRGLGLSDDVKEG